MRIQTDDYRIREDHSGFSIEIKCIYKYKWSKNSVGWQPINVRGDAYSTSNEINLLESFKSLKEAKKILEHIKAKPIYHY